MGTEYLLMVGMYMLSGFTVFFRKKYTQLTSASAFSGSLVYIIAVGFISMLSYWLLSGCNIQASARILTFSVISSFIYNAVNITMLLAYNKVNLILLSIFTKSVTIFNWLCGVFFFNEVPTAFNVISILILCCAVFLPLLDLKDNKSNLRITYLFGGLMFILSAANAMTQKLFLNHPSVDTTAMSSMLFFTNGFTTIIPSLILLFRFKKSPVGFKQEFSVIRWPAIACILLACTVGNPYSLLNSIVMQAIPLVQYSVLTAAFESTTTLVLSKFVFKEKIGKITFIAFILCAVAMVINAL